MQSSNHQHLLTALLRPAVDLQTTYAQVTLPIEEDAPRHSLCNELLSLCSPPSGLVVIPEGDVLVLVCHKVSGIGHAL